MQAGGCFGILATIYAMDRWGRKASVICISVVGVISGSLLCASQNMAMFMVFRFFAGFASWGAVTVSTLHDLDNSTEFYSTNHFQAPVFSAELSPTSLRGFFGGMNGIAIGIGYAFATYMGLAFYDTHSTSLDIWRGPYGISLIFSFIPLISMFFVPESPRWLLMAGRIDDAKKAMQKLKDLKSAEWPVDSVAEFYQMEKQVEHDKEMSTSWAQMVRLPADRRRVALAAGFAFLAQSTAILGAFIP